MSADPNQPPVIPGPRDPSQAAAPSPAFDPPAPQSVPTEQASYTPPAFEAHAPERTLLEKRPEILVGLAAAGGFVAAQLLGRIRGR
ncbi:MAG: hypothetical protein F2813_03840 [Actinobacteria bacterium]|uniref:Unannotated protein n=1 Tax=freshwater metagenome TaxID=449393 RepID=A0A6J5ZPN6_9ZZZZ|nr:hypothetical protein [Actinomycetota bacterium]